MRLVVRPGAAPAEPAASPFARLRLDPEARAPLHAQLTAGLRDLIVNEQLRSGTELPGEVELATMLGISRHTVRHALGALVAEGRLRRQRGANTVVSQGPVNDVIIERRLGSFYAFAWELEARGREPHSRVLARTPLAADARLAQVLDVELGTPLERIERLRMAEEEALTLEVAVLPANLTATLDQASLEHESLYDVLEQRAGVVVVRARETLRPIVLNRRAADLLGVPPGSPAFAIERVSWAEQGPIEWQQSVIRGDRYLYSVDLPRRQPERLTG